MWICSWIWIYFPFLPTGVKTKSKSVGNWQKRAQWKQKPKIQCVWLFVQKVHGIAFESPEIKNHPLGAFNQPASECNSQFSTRILINFLFLPPFFFVCCVLVCSIFTHSQSKELNWIYGYWKRNRKGASEDFKGEGQWINLLNAKNAGLNLFQYSWKLYETIWNHHKCTSNNRFLR